VNVFNYSDKRFFGDVTIFEKGYSMDVLKVAQEMELEGKAYYEKMATETPIAELKGVFQFLANEEQHHFDLFKALDGKGNAPEAAGTETLHAIVKDAFGRITYSFMLPDVVYDYQAIYEKALQMEKDAVKYYSEMFDAVAPDQKRTLEFIINQEKSHARLLEALIEFVNHPKSWIENSEWHHLDAY
jgi:rubrerythrin